jgi:hypothetical protein
MDADLQADLRSDKDADPWYPSGESRGDDYAAAAA